MYTNDVCNLGNFRIAFTSKCSTAKRIGQFGIVRNFCGNLTIKIALPAVMMPKEHSGIVNGNYEVVDVGKR